MKYIINLERRDSEPLDIAQVVALYQGGALKRNSRLKDEGAPEWSTVEKVMPFIAGVRTWSELASQGPSTSGAMVSANIKKIDLGFGDLVGFIFKFALASIPAAILLWFVFMVLGVVFAGLIGGLAHAVR